MFSAVLLHLHTLKQTLCHCHMSQAAQRLLHESVDILYMVCSADLHLAVGKKAGRACHHILSAIIVPSSLARLSHQVIYSTVHQAVYHFR